ncbi:putative benzyl alcohol O-benzoyltransferase [Helianthus annuus]|nr:putative benzyl alcohol O-benzoyltransferase [Helianthus annuus]KAJ0624539.1 putative benzyl alcohol O-benzoyltransferase [Helianthus annuus]
MTISNIQIARQIVTRLLCGGFILTVRFNHTMSDAAGFVQFMIALSEIANGASEPSTLPVWQRELLCARDPPRVTCAHHEYDEVDDNTNGTIVPLDDDMEHRSFFFGPTQISAIRRFIPTHLQKCSTFEVLTACLWRCRTMALEPNPEDEMRITCLVNARSKLNPPLPVGYYGNAICFTTAISTARDLCSKPLGHALELVMKAKSDVTDEYMRSVADFMVIKGRPHFTTTRTYIVTDVTRAGGLTEVDLGWGKPVYAGPSEAGVGNIPYVASFYVRFISHKGESGIVVPIWLPSAAMKRFVKELNTMLMQDNNDQDLQEHKLLDRSKL